MRRQPARRPIRALVAVLIGLSLASLACGTDTDPAPDASTEGVQGEAGLCANVNLLGESLDGVQGFTSTTSLREAEAARQKVELSLSELQEAETRVPTNLTAKLQSSFTDFDAMLDSMGSGQNPPATLSDEAAGLKARAEGLFEAQEELKMYALCPEQGGR